MDNPAYHVQYKYHQQDLCRAFGDFFDRQVLCDVTLKCDGRSYGAHKFALSAASPYFEAIFVNINSKRNLTVTLNDVSHKAILAILEFIYKGETNVSPNVLPDFLDTCHNLEIRGIGDENYTDTDTDESNRTVDNVTKRRPVPKNTSDNLQKSRSNGPKKTCNNVENTPKNTNSCDRITLKKGQEPSSPQEILEIADDETETPPASTQSTRFFKPQDPDLKDSSDIFSPDIFDDTIVLIPGTEQRPHCSKHKLGAPPRQHIRFK